MIYFRQPHNALGMLYHDALSCVPMATMSQLHNVILSITDCIEANADTVKIRPLNWENSSWRLWAINLKRREGGKAL